MRPLLRILDSYPTRPKHRFRGQSLVEIAFTAPILFFMIVGLAEVAYLAANYIILTDALRTGARYGVNQDVAQWPETYTRNDYRLACYGQPQYTDYIPGQNQNIATLKVPAVQYYNKTGLSQTTSGYTTNNDAASNSANWGLYDGVACQVLNNMSPLSLNPASDDIAVSIVAYTGWDPAGPKVPTPFMRYPLFNSYCAPTTTSTGSPGDDPKDFGSAMSLAPGSFSADLGGGSGLQPEFADGKVRGFVLTGNMQNPNDPNNCIGSYFYLGNTADTGAFNLVHTLRTSTSGFKDPSVQSDVDAASRNGSMIIVEIQYYHKVLFGFPPFNVFLAKGFPLHLWSIFPQFSSAPPLSAPGSNNSISP